MVKVGALRDKCLYFVMKASIHPKYYPKAKVTCACGHSFETGSTKEKIDVELCGKCHPFYTGTQKLIDTAGNVEKFQAKMARAKKGRIYHLPW